ncbi:hypothetical protein CASFOL_024800 [Castilleja foliolosa]|uniref:NAC domain-containing protein n=1 Tax=Castilleja foliolosa TaxID=1961234 RepID=A0ABD3CR97_9LAMI
MRRFPIGFRFNPSEEEKLKYLVQKISGCKSMPPCDDFISTIDLYGKKILGKFLGILKTRSATSSRSSRKLGQKVPIYGGNNKIIGHKRCFRYESKKEEEDRNNSSSCKWLLKEYTLPDNVMRKEFKDYAFCVLKKKKGSNNSPRNVDDHRAHEECGLDDLMESIMSSNCTSPGLDFAVPALPIVRDDDRAVDIVEECGVDSAVSLPIVRDDELNEITDSDLSDLWVIENDEAAAVEAAPIDVDMSSPPIIDLCSIIENIDNPAGEPVEECSIIENMDKSGAEPAAEPVEDGSDFDCMFDDVPEDPSCDYNFSLADIPMDRFPALWT